MSKIEWTEATWNPIVGCSIISPGCTNCYAMRMAARLEAMGRPQYAGLTRPSKAGAVWTGVMRLVENALLLPLRTRKPTTYFVNSMSDLFHESVPDAWIDRVFAVMALAPQHTFQVLTKRARRMRAYCARRDERGRHPSMTDAALMAATGRWNTPARDLRRWPLPNVWLGVSAEDQRRADERVPELLATPAAVRFVSAEPLLGSIDFTAIAIDDHYVLDALRGLYVGLTPEAAPYFPNNALDWIIVGGESGPGARPMHPDWARQIRDVSAAAGVAFHFKQHGAWTVAIDREAQDPDWRADYSGRLNDSRPGVAWLNLKGGRGFHGERFHVMRRVGKAAAGRLLDGLTHDDMPAVRHG
ncbi:phage Gp37/Gp68 family protein [Methylobacterium fujisawaense]|uniref:phage Gp37/Gp68 family protein n=1 Tax=Methylobacterium fujisawaense TaxID=107400 RepID=UPI00313B9B13